MSPVLDFVYEIFASRPEVIFQAFVNEMFTLAKRHAAFDELEAGGKQEWIHQLDRIFDLINFVLSCTYLCKRPAACVFMSLTLSYSFLYAAETLRVRKSAFEKFKTWLSGIEVLTKGRDKKQLAELDQEHHYKKGFLSYSSGISLSLLSLFAEAEAEKPSEPVGGDREGEGSE